MSFEKNSEYTKTEIYKNLRTVHYCDNNDDFETSEKYAEIIFNTASEKNFCRYGYVSDKDKIINIPKKRKDIYIVLGLGIEITLENNNGEKFCVSLENIKNVKVINNSQKIKSPKIKIKTKTKSKSKSIGGRYYKNQKNQKTRKTRK